MHNHMVLFVCFSPIDSFTFFPHTTFPRGYQQHLQHGTCINIPRSDDRVCLELFLSMGVVDALSASSVSALFASAPRDLYRHEHFVSH